MESAPLGDLKQHLEARANETYYNVTSSQSFEMKFINQIIEGVQAVHQLDVNSVCLSVCLSVSLSIYIYIFMTERHKG